MGHGEGERGCIAGTISIEFGDSMVLTIAACFNMQSMCSLGAVYC